MWEPIATALKTEYILIREENWEPDLVHWRDKVEIKSNKENLSRPAGWFRRSGQRSTTLCPTEWMKIPR
jgi:hypothetical protein